MSLGEVCKKQERVKFRKIFKYIINQTFGKLGAKIFTTGNDVLGN